MAIASVARNYAKSVSLDAVKITADGKRVPLGTISYWHRNPFMRLMYVVKRFFNLV